MIKLLGAVLTVVNFIKTLLFGKDTSHLNGDVLFPGHLNFANKGGEYFHGSKAKKFFTLRGLNEWCLPGNDGANALVAEVIPTLLGYVVIYNRKLTKRDEDTVDRFGREINAKIAEENAKWEAEEQANRDAKMKEEIEEKRLAEIGRKYEARVSKIKSSSIGKERDRQMKELNSGKLDE